MYRRSISSLVIILVFGHDRHHLATDRHTSASFLLVTIENSAFTVYGLAKSIDAAAVVAAGATPLLHTQADGAAVWLESGGPLVHHDTACQAVVVVAAALPGTNVPRTRMGMMAPVLRLKVLWPRTRRSEAASPECVVIEIIEAESEAKIWSRTILLR